jgi:hypothetical protein
MKPTRKRGRKTVRKGSLKPLYIFFLILVIGGLCLYAEVIKPVIPSPPPDGTVPVTLGNASSRQMDIRIITEAGKIYGVIIPRCPTCQDETIPPLDKTPCPADTAYKSFTLKPERYKVDIVRSDGTVSYSSNLNLTDGKPFNKGTCFFQARIPPKHRDLQEK